MTEAVYDLLDPSLSPQDQGWQVINEQGAPGHYNPARPVQATADGSAVTVSSIGLPPDIDGIATSALQWFYRPIDVALHRPYTIEFSARVDALLGPSNGFDSATMLYAGTEDPSGFGQFTGVPRDQMIMLDADRIKWGDESQTFDIDTTDGFHDYRIEVAPGGQVEVYVDDTLALWRDDFEALGTIGFGDMTNDVRLDGTLSVADVIVTGTPAAEAERTTFYLTGAVRNTSDPNFAETVIAGLFDLLPGDATTYALALEDSLLAPGVPVALDLDDPAYAWDIELAGRQIGDNPYFGPGFTPNADLSGFDALQGSVAVDPFDGPHIFIDGGVARIVTDDDIYASITGTWVANQPGAPSAASVDGTNDADILGGTGADDFLRGLDGDDYLRGFAADDVIDGGAGDDNLYGKEGDDRLFGQDGEDSMRGDAGEDHLFGGAGNDFMRGGDDDDLLYGEAGDDRMEGDGGNDILDGGLGNDSLRGETGDDTLLGGDGHDSLKGGSGDDVLSGGAGRDTLNGNDGQDLLNGGAGDDSLDGGSGDDVLFGGAGYDSLVGGPGDDRYVFTNGDGGDEIFGFQAGAGSDDVIDLTAYFGRPASFADLMARAWQAEDHTVLDLRADNSDAITLWNVALADLHPDDILL